VSVFATLAPSGMIELRVRDDGGGIDFAKLRNRLINVGRVSPEAAANLSESQLARVLFEPGFTSMADHEGSEDAGRGVGLDLAAACTKRPGSRARVRPRLGEFTEFAFLVPANARPQTEAA